ncbi:MAG: ExeA family protein [Massilia sp.]
MYTAHFQLQEPPFGLTPDTSYFVASPPAQAALNTLLVAVRSGEGFIKITGEVGTGKTLLCRKFMASLGEDCLTAFLPNPYLTPRTLLLALADELGLDVDERIDQHRLLKTITQQLLMLARQGKRVVLCLDEVQAMPRASLESIRLLSNLETEKRKLLQIVLFGQPELDLRLAAPDLRQLAQRISFHYQLAPLQRADLALYVAHRLQVAAVAGGSASALFSPAAISALHRASGGVPRLVNIVAHKALMLAYGQGHAGVERADVVRAAADTLGVRRAGWTLAGWLKALLHGPARGLR